MILTPLIHAIQDLARARGLKNHRVAYKENARGEHVVAIIIPDLRDVTNRDV